MVEKYLNILKVNLKFHLAPHMLVALALCIISPLVMGVRNLDLFNTAKILEMYISLLGIILLIPVFLPDQDKDIRQLIQSKPEPMWMIHILRTLEAFLVLMVLIMGFLVFLVKGNCTFPFWDYVYGVMANCIFLGGMGVMVYAVIDNIPVAYMVPILYYILCYGGGKNYLGHFYLFSMLGGSVEDKIYLLVSGIVMIVIGLVLRNKVVQC